MFGVTGRVGLRVGGERDGMVVKLVEVFVWVTRVVERR